MGFFDDLIPSGGNAQAPPIDPQHRDLAIRTIYGEAANEPDQGQAAVAAVIKNRMQAGRYGGDSIPGVVLAKNQFEPWNTPAGRQRMMSLNPNDPSYQKIGGIVDQVFSGQMEDPTNGATHFVAPQAQAALGRSMPSWAQGEGQPIGRHTFFAPEGRVAQVAQASRPSGLFDDLLPQQQAQQQPPSGLPADNGGQFGAPPAGGNFRTAREGDSQAPPGFLDRLSAMWENPPKDRLSIIGMVKPTVQGADTLMKAGHGDIPMTVDGHTNPAVIQGAADFARGMPMSGVPGGVFGRALTADQGLIANVARPAVAAPTRDELVASAKAGFESPAVKGLEVAPRAINEFGQGVRAKLNEAGIDENLAPKTFGVLSKLEQVPSDAVVTGANLQSLRRTFQNAAGTPDKTERLAASKVIDAIDEFVPNVAARDILSGDPKAAAQAWAGARGDYAAAMRSDEIAKALIKAQRQADAAGSGANIDNATRQQFKAILNSDKRSRGFSSDERDAMEEAIKGTTWGNFARLIGKAAPTGIVSGALSGGAGLAAGGPVGAVMLPVAGLIGKMAGDRSTARQIAALDELVRSRAPLMKAFEDAAAKRQAIDDVGVTAKTMSGLSLASRNLANNLRDSGINLSPADIMRSLQGPMKSAADQDQQN